MKTRPLRVVYTSSDPLDDRPLMKTDLPYEPRKAALGFYTGSRLQREIQCVKAVWPDVLEMREPLISIKLEYATP